MVEFGHSDCPEEMLVDAVTIVDCYSLSHPLGRSFVVVVVDLAFVAVAEAIVSLVHCYRIVDSLLAMVKLLNTPHFTIHMGQLIVTSIRLRTELSPLLIRTKLHHTLCEAGT